MGLGSKKRQQPQRPNDALGDDERKRDAIRKVVERKEDPDRQVEELEHLMLAQPSQATTDQLWKILVGVLAVVLVIALCGLIALAFAGKSNQTVVTVFSSALAALIGLFVPSSSEGSS